jgi:hypothetical protein
MTDLSNISPETDAPAPPEAGAPEAGAPEAGAPEAGAPEAGAPEAGAEESRDLDALREDLIARARPTAQDLIDRARPEPLKDIWFLLRGIDNAVTNMAGAGLTDEIEAFGAATGKWLNTLLIAPREHTAETLRKGLPPRGPAKPGFREYGEWYSQALEQSRVLGKQFHARHPKSSVASQVVGGFAGFGGLARGAAAAGAARFARPIAQTQGFLKTVRQGALIGSVESFGLSEGTPLQVIGDTATGAVLGGGFAGILQPLGRALGALGKRNLTKTERITLNKVLDAFRRDGKSIEDAMQTLAVWHNSGGEGAVLADAGGNSVRRLLRAVVTTPSEAGETVKTTVIARQAEQADRIFDAAAAALTGKRGLHTTVDGLKDLRRQNAGPAYQEAYASELVPVSPEVMQQFLGLLQTPMMRRAVKEMKEAALDFRKPLPDFIDKKGRIIELPDVETLDFLKREGIDSILQNMRKNKVLDLDKPKVRRALELRREFMEISDQLSPALKRARDIYAGDSDSLLALQIGKEWAKRFREGPEKALASIADMTMADKDFWRIGVAQWVRDLAETTPEPRDFILQIFGNKRLREALRVAMPNEEAGQQFDRAMQREIQFRATFAKANIDAGSPTAPIQEELRDIADTIGLTPQATQTVVEAVLGKPLRAAVSGTLSFFASFRRADRARRMEIISNGIAEILMTGDPNDLARVFARFESAVERGADLARAGAPAQTVGGVAAAVTTTETRSRPRAQRTPPRIE